MSVPYQVKALVISHRAHEATRRALQEGTAKAHREAQRAHQRATKAWDHPGITHNDHEALSHIDEHRGFSASHGLTATALEKDARNPATLSKYQEMRARAEQASQEAHRTGTDTAHMKASNAHYKAAYHANKLGLAEQETGHRNAGYAHSPAGRSFGVRVRPVPGIAPKRPHRIFALEARATGALQARLHVRKMGPGQRHGADGKFQAGA